MAASMSAERMPRPGPTRAAASASERSPAMVARPRRSLRVAASSSMFLASHTVQVISEAKTRPTITDCTRMSAVMNIDHGERSRGRCALPMTGSVLGGGDAGAAAGAPVPCAPHTPTRMGRADRMSASSMLETRELPAARICDFPIMRCGRRILEQWRPGPSLRP